jgi:hypothetical protein
MLLRTTYPVFVAALGGMIFAQNTAPKPEVPAVVQAKSFVMLDQTGRKRGEMSMTQSGKPIIQLFDERGRVLWDSTDEPRMKPLLIRPSF